MENCDVKQFIACQVSLWLWRTVPNIQLVFGTVGNILNVIILSRQKFRVHSTTVYLICLSFADLMTLWTFPFIRMLRHGFSIDPRNQSDIFCKLIPWLNYSAAGYSVWLLVALTVERMLLTRCPVYARSKLSCRKSLVVAMVLMTITFVLPVYLLFGFKIQSIPVTKSNGTVFQSVCHFTSNSFRNFYKTIRAWIALLALNVIPILIIASGNLVILLTLIQQRKKVKTVTAPTDYRRWRVYPSSRSKSSTRTILVVCLCFIVTTLPHTISEVVQGQLDTSMYSDEEYAYQALQHTIMSLLLYCNFSCNFLLYVVSGTLFKQELRAFLTKSLMKFRSTVSATQGDMPVSQIAVPSLRLSNTCYNDSLS